MSTTTMKERILDLVVKSVISNAVNVGNRLNLFKFLAEISDKTHPVLPEELAKAAGCKERYVREWCNCLACGGFLEVDADEKFWIAEENVADLTGDGFEMACNEMMPTFLEALDSLVECFKSSGPYGLEYSQFSKFQTCMWAVSKSLHQEHLVPHMIPAIGIEEQLRAGGLKVLDVGCGKGFHSSLLAEEYPDAQFIGIDIGEHAIEHAKLRTMSSGAPFSNLEFVQCDAKKMPDSWTESFDLVLIFDAFHDQIRPDLCISEIHRVLKPNGLFAMVDIAGSSNVFEDKQTLGPMAAMMYGCSMFHCLPIGSNSPDALCYGAMWGRKRAIGLMNRCGFPNVRVVETPYSPLNVMYLARKI